MSITVTTFKWGKCVLLIGMIPFLFACSKSKFSSVKTQPATVGESNNPTPDTDNDDDTSYENPTDEHDDYDHPCQPNCNHPCKPPKPVCKYGKDAYGNCKPPKPVCEYGEDSYGNCKPPKPVCKYGEDSYGNCKPPKPVCQYGQDSYGKCKPKPNCPYGCNDDGSCKPKPCEHGQDAYGNCKPPKPVCKYGVDSYGNCKPPKPVCEYGQDNNGNCKSDCQDYEYEVPEYKGPKAVNVWVVMDGSKSNAPERYAQLLALVEMYEKNIGRKLPITLSVIAGHSKESQHSVLGGGLFFKHGSEPAVLRFEPGMSTSKRQAAVNALNAKIQGMATDNSSGVSDGGELLTANLLAALTAKNLDRAEQMGAFGKGNILNIHFVGDENDICTPGQVEDFDKITVNGKVMSREEYARQKNCGPLKVGKDGYSQTLVKVMNDIEKSGQAQIHLTGFIYTGENKIPRKSATDENEVGHGMLELIDVMNGKAFDLALLTSKGNYESGAKKLVTHINIGSGMYATYEMDKSKAPFANMDTERTVVTLISNGQPVGYRTDSKTNTMYLYNCPAEGGKVRIRYCPKKKK